MLSRRRMIVLTGIIVGEELLASRAFPAGTKLTAGDVQAQLEKIEIATGGRLGVAIADTGSDRTIVYRGDERFPMCSTAKVLACAALLARVDARRESLGRHVQYAATDLVAHSPMTKEHVGGDGVTLAALCEAALTVSDNTAMDLILANIGGPAAVTDFARTLGDGVTRLDRTEPSLNEAAPGDSRDTTTPVAMMSDLQKLVLGSALSPASRERLQTWMVGCTTGDTKLRAGVPRTWRVGDKTGNGDQGSSNDIAVMWPPDQSPIVAVVYLTGAMSVSEDVRAAASAAVGRLAAVWTAS